MGNTARAIAAAGPDVYVGGAFTNAGGDTDADYIARWGPAWGMCMPLVARDA